MSDSLLSTATGFLQNLDRDAYAKLALGLFVVVPVVATVLNIISQVRASFFFPSCTRSSLANRVVLDYKFEI